MQSSFFSALLVFAQVAWFSSGAVPNARASQRRLVVQEEAREVSRQLEAQGAAMPVGFYIAFDPDVRLAYATSACDDDGDYVVVLSDALLLAANYVSLGATEASSFAATLDRVPHSNRLPLPASLEQRLDGSAAHAYYTDIVRALLEREMTPLAVKPGASVPAVHRCAHPTETHEAADEVWTVDEQKAAQSHGDRVHQALRPPTLPDLPGRFRTMLDRCAQTSYFSSFARWNGTGTVSRAAL